MAIDKLVDSTQLDSDLESIANAIRERSLGSSLLDSASDFISEIEAIPGVVKKTYKFTKSSSGRTEYLTNSLAPDIPQVILVQADMDDFPANPTSGTIMLGCETISGPIDNSSGYDNYLACTTYYNSSGAVASTYCYEGSYRPGISDDRQTIRLGVRYQTGSTFLAGVEYSVDLYYFPLTSTIPSAAGVSF